ncbi:MAG: SufS family cysteine desulfurase [Litorilituus sp.]|nr:SufS family cysteine desulfurase [Litorilituus sp.]
MKNFDPNYFCQQFPLLTENLSSQDKPIIYFDNAATTQKPICVIDSYKTYYHNFNANVHRASHALSAKATTAFEKVREDVKRFIHAKSSKEIIWTKGSTESLNLIACTLGEQIVNRGDEIIVAVSEHHANIVPWQLLAKKKGAVIKVLTLDDNGVVDINAFEKLINTKTKIVCCSHISNVIGKINPIKAIVEKAKALGAISVIDGAQAIAHVPVNVQSIGCDFYVFSAHKMFGPTGVGVLYGKQALLEVMPPYQAGGEMIKTVSFNQETTFNTLPFKFEAGTPNIAGVVAFGQAINFTEQYDVNQLQHYEKKLGQYCYQALRNIPQIHFIVQHAPDIPLFSFTVDGHHNHDIASTLDSLGIAIRSGHHCAMPLMEYLNISGCLRVSLATYNSIEEVDYFIACLQKIIANTDNQVVYGQQENTDKEQSLASDKLVTQFANLDGWHNRHREIMLLSKQLTRLDKAARNDDSLIRGCESLAWLQASCDKQGIYTFEADSDAKVIRGLLVIVLAAFNGKTAQEIQHFDIDGYFESLGLIRQLSPSRSNGLLAIVEKIKSLVVSVE